MEKAFTERSKTMKMRILLTLVALFTGILLASPALAEMGHGHHPNGAEKSEKMMEKCKEMMDRHETMHAKMAEKDQRLQELLDRMNAADGEEKVTAIADVLNELIEQRRAMHGMMMKMGPDMVRHMMEHMDSAKMQEMMKQCPMMKKMKERADADHAEHH
jgi:hypothetical protein